jgi:hypothetical protein
MSSQLLLPVGFEALTPFVEFWAVDTAAERAHRRDSSGEERRLAFYNAATELVPGALDYLDQKPLGQLDENEQRLMKLMLSFAHVTLSIELLRDEEPKHAQYRPFMRITRATADL